jgi:hypothetical protein
MDDVESRSLMKKKEVRVKNEVRRKKTMTVQEMKLMMKKNEVR